MVNYNILIMNRMKYFKKNKFLKDTFILTLGVGIAQIIPILAYPILSRIYVPEDFGLLSPITSINAILGIIVTLKYENAILITRNKHDCSILVCSILIIALLLLAFIELFILAFSEDISILLNNNSLKYWLWVCPISASCIVLFNCFNEWCVRYGRFKTLSINKIINGVALPGGKLLLSGSLFKSFGLIVGDLLGHLITGISCCTRLNKAEKDFFKNISRTEIIRVLKRYIDCPKFILPGQLLNKVAYELPVFIIMARFSTETVGFYSMAVMVLALPTIVIGRSIGDTFRKKASDIYQRDGRCVNFFLRIVLFSASLSFCGFLLIYFISPQLFMLVLGEEWVVSAYYCKILCPMLAISFVSQIVSSVYIIVEKMRLLLYWQILYFVSTLAGLYVGAFYFHTIEATLWGLAIGRSLSHFINILVTYRMSSQKSI